MKRWPTQASILENSNVSKVIYYKCMYLHSTLYLLVFSVLYERSRRVIRKWCTGCRVGNSFGFQWQFQTCCSSGNVVIALVLHSLCNKWIDSAPKFKVPATSQRPTLILGFAIFQKIFARHGEWCFTLCFISVILLFVLSFKFLVVQNLYQLCKAYKFLNHGLCLMLLMS